MAFTLYDLEPINEGFFSTGNYTAHKYLLKMPYYFGGATVSTWGVVQHPKLIDSSMNTMIGNFTTSGTSGSGGTTILSGGSYAWIG
jgi:hypothetical protein